MDNTTWAFGPDGPQWPVDGSGQKEKAVRLMNSFDSAADSDMTISLLAAYWIPCFKYYERSSTAFPATARGCTSRRRAARRPRRFCRRSPLPTTTNNVRKE